METPEQGVKNGKEPDPVWETLPKEAEHSAHPRSAAHKYGHVLAESVQKYSRERNTHALVL